jgi:TetR/AcrR family transcriptional repressor of nem operon
MGTKEGLIEVAEDISREFGYNGFSFRDIEQRVGIRSASIHHHFKTKADLGRAILNAYKEHYLSAVQSIERASGSAPVALVNFFELMKRSLRGGARGCLCSMFAAESASLPPEVRLGVKEVYVEIEGWLAKLLERGRNEGGFIFSGDAALVSRAMFACLQGGMVSSMLFQDVGRFDEVCEVQLQLVGV